MHRGKVCTQRGKEKGRKRKERKRKRNKKGEKIDLQKIIIMKQLRFRSTSLARGIGEILTS